MVSKEYVESSSLRIYCTKNHPKWTRGKKVTALPSRGGHFYKKEFLIEQFITYFWTPQKILKYYSIAFRVRTWFVKFKMAISEQFKLLNLNQKSNEKVMHRWRSRKGQNEEKWKKKKNAFCNSKKCIFFTALVWLLLGISKIIFKAWEG